MPIELCRGDGVLFEDQSTPTGLPMDARGLAHNQLAPGSGGLWIAVGDNPSDFQGGGIATSPDGETWTRRAANVDLSNVDPSIHGVGYGNGKWVAVGGGGKAHHSANGTAWTQVVIDGGAGGTFERVAYSPDLARWVAAGDLPATGKGLWHSDDDGATWAAASGSGVDQAFVDIVWSDRLQKYFAITNGSVYASDDGDTWTATDLSSFGTIYGVAERDGALVIVGADGLIITSTDGGTTWISRVTENNSAFGGAQVDLKTVGFGEEGVVVAGAAVVESSLRSK